MFRFLDRLRLGLLAPVFVGVAWVAITILDGIGTGMTLMEAIRAVPELGLYIAKPWFGPVLITIGFGGLILVEWKFWTLNVASHERPKLLDERGKTIPWAYVPVLHRRSTIRMATIASVAAIACIALWIGAVRLLYSESRGTLKLATIQVFGDNAQVASGRTLAFRVTFLNQGFDVAKNGSLQILCTTLDAVTPTGHGDPDVINSVFTQVVRAAERRRADKAHRVHVVIGGTLYSSITCPMMSQVLAERIRIGKTRLYLMFIAAWGPIPLTSRAAYSVSLKTPVPETLTLSNGLNDWEVGTILEGGF